MPRLRLRGGEVVDAAKDCDCITHDGPHWLHMDALDRRRNRELLATSPRGFIVEERVRLAEKLGNMERLGVVEILED